MQTIDNCDSKHDNDNFRNMHIADEESSYSSFYSSFLKTDTGSGSNDDSTNITDTYSKKYDVCILQFTFLYELDKVTVRKIFIIKLIRFQRPWTKLSKYSQTLRKREPPWLEAVSVTPELIYRYQMSMNRLQDILETDLNSLKRISQVSISKNCF